MKKSFMNNIKHFVDSNVRQRIDRVAHNNNEFFGDDLLLVERHFEEIRNVCVEVEKRISIMLQSIQATQSFGAYTQNVQSGLNNLSQNISHATGGAVTTSANSSSTNNLVTNNSNIPNANRESSKSTKKHLNPTTQSNRSNEFNGDNNDRHLDHSDVESTQLFTNDMQQRHKKLPPVGFLKFLLKFSNKLRPDSLLATTFTHCSQLQTQLTKLYLSSEQTIEARCLKPVQHILEFDVPNVIRLRKLFIKSHNDLESIRSKYTGASQKQLLQSQAGHSTTNSYIVSQANNQQSNLNKLDQLKKELDDALIRFEQAKDIYETELYAFVCLEPELVDLLSSFYQLQAEYHQQIANAIQGSLPGLGNTLANTSRKLVFGTHLNEHLRCTGRLVSPVVEICTHLLYNQGLREEGLFRVPGSSVKIKKLKNAINAWFVNLDSSNNVQIGSIESGGGGNSEQRQTGHSSVVGLHNLFKQILGQIQTVQNESQQPKQSTMSDDSNALKHNNEVNSKSNLLYFDVHSIAGLLKLYLRELPDPLFTFEQYDQWIDAVKCNSNDERLNAISRVLQQIPKTNYENLKHLIKFLHILTCHQEHNKMTSTNLAITMAPSLMWPPDSNSLHQQRPASANDPSVPSNDLSAENADSLNAQMSNIGMSASLHALVLETLIKNADILLTGEVDFSLPGFEDLSLNLTEPSQYKHRDRSSVKSISPTGLSTTSSSSFSSSTSQQQKTKPNQPTMRTHSRKGGSMDGLINETIDYESVLFKSGLSNTHGGGGGGRPMSVFLQKNDYSTIRPQRQRPPPPIPPMPASRTYLKSTTKTTTTTTITPQAQTKTTPRDSTSNLNTTTTAAATTKWPAPPAPQAASSRVGHSGVSSSEHLDQKDQVFMTSSGIEDSELKPRAASLRGTGTIATVLSSTNGQAASTTTPRPNVPPPDRPRKPDGLSNASPSNGAQINNSLKNNIRSLDESGGGGDSSKTSSHSLTSSGHLRADFEEISATELDDANEADISAPDSPVVSLNSQDDDGDGDKVGSDSSFNDDVDDAQSLEFRAGTQM